MHFSLPSVTIALLALLHCHGALSASTPAQGGSNCADPSSTVVMTRAFVPGALLHVLGQRWDLESGNTKIGSAYFVNIDSIFRAWTSQQPLTVPLFGLQATNGQDFLYIVGADANTPPAVSGFSSTGVKAWVYDTPVCGSVPLMQLVRSAQSDRYWTTNAIEHDGLISDGWTDGGIIAYVLPLSASS